MTFDSRDLRNAFGGFATGVTVITTKPNGASAIGITANSFSSLSIEPPLVLWCIDKGSDTLSTFDQATAFAINVLARDQEELSTQFAQIGDHALNGVAHDEGKTGSPLLQGSVGYFDCEIEARHDAGDHIIMVGRVVDFASDDSRQPLVFYRGNYRDLV